MKRFITHIFNEGIPPMGLRKLSYLTITDEDTDSIEYFLGTDNNPLEEDTISTWIKEGKLIPIKENFPELKDDKSLYIDSNGDIYFAERYDSERGREKLKIHIQEFTKLAGKVKAQTYIPKHLPQVKNYHELF